jgi:AcrR family transcriptional regulator
MANLQGRILSCALDLYLEKGIHGLSMRQIAAKLDISATAIYRHYQNKQDLLDTIVAEAVKIFGGYLFAALSGATPEERFRLSSQAYLDFAMAQPKYYGVIFLEPHDQPELANFQFFVDRVQECVDTGYFRKANPRSLALSIWAYDLGLMAIYLSGKSSMDEAAFRKFYWESQARFLHGVCP